MAYNFQKISERDLARGLDQRSTENTLKEGYAETLQNVDTNSNGFLSKRPGYEGYYGTLPIRVRQIVGTAATDTLEFFLDTSINTAFLDSSPLVVQGKLSSAATGDWGTTDSSHYYTGFVTGIPDTWTVGGSPFPLLAARHQETSDNLLVGSLESTSTSDNSNSLVLSEVTIDSSFNVDYNYIIPSDIEAFVFVEDKSIVAGSSYSAILGSHTGTVTYKIDQGTHNLDNLSLVVSVYEVGSPDVEVQADVKVYTVTTGPNILGDIDIEIENGGPSKTYRVVISSVPINNTVSRTYAASETADMVITNFTDNFYFVNVYANDAGVLTKVIPNGVVHDDAANTLTISLINSKTTTQVFEAFFEPATITAGSIKVTDTTGISGNYTDTAPQLTLWGIPHSELSSTGTFAGHANHIDSYRRTNEQRMIAGLGGNLFTARTRAESGTSHFIPSNTINLQSTVVVDADIAPAFAREVSFTDSDVVLGTDTLAITAHGFVTADPIVFTGTGIPGELTAGIQYFAVVTDANNLQVAATAADANSGVVIGFSTAGSGSSTMRQGNLRTRGLVYSPDVNRAGGAKVTAATFVSAGIVDYTLTLSAKTGADSADGTTISTTAGLPDKLTVSGLSFPSNNGSFLITSVTEPALVGGTATITIRCENSAGLLADFNESGSQGRAAIYTDKVTVADNAEYLAGDTILGSVFADTSVTVLQATGTSVILEGVTEGTNVPSGLKIFGSRLSDVVPLEGVVNLANAQEGTEGVEGFVRKDMCTVSGLSRKIRVKFVNPDIDNSITAVTNTAGTVTLTLGAAHQLRVGQKVLLLRTGIAAFEGEQTITVVSDSTPTSGSDQITFVSTDTTSTSLGANSPIVKGNTLEIDEEITIQDDGNSPTTFSVEGRWIPVEAPTTSDTLPSPTYYRHLDASSYTAQSILRSGIVNDNMYLTNGDDEVLKFDGTNVYQAGIFRWQPQLFVQIDTTTGSIVRNSTVAAVSAVSGNKFTVAAGEASQFVAGDRVYWDDGTAVTETLTVKSVDDLVIYTTTDITVGDGTGTLRLVDRYRYYFRLNAIDANQNIIASAATGATDFIVELFDSAQIKMRLLGFPVWGNYDYDALELEIYRTRANTASDYRLLQTLDLGFSAGEGYVDYTDATTDESLEFLPNDVVHSVLKGAELGTAWSQPLRAKYNTVTNNTLLLANVKDYPQLDLQILPTAGFVVSDLTTFGGSAKLLFRRDSADAGVTTDMGTRVNYQFIDPNVTTVKTITDITLGDGTTATIDISPEAFTSTPVAGDWVYCFHSSVSTSPKLDRAGWFRVVSATGDTVEIATGVISTYAAADDVDTIVMASDPTDVPVWLGEDLNYGQLLGNALNQVTAMNRLASAINASMRLTEDAGFTPWLVANAGSEYNAGQVVVRQEKIEATTPTVVVPVTVSSNLKWFVQGINRAAGTEVSASTQVFNSRILISYPNFPEIFDNPFGDTTASDSVVDINAADGEEITGIIPFFGRAVFGASQIEGVVVVFKTNSIYLLNVGTRQFTKIQSRGLGCTAPFSIATTRDGIIFANESGIYRLNRDQSISYVGKFVERIWEDRVNRTDLSRATGHHYAIGRKYKLSLPVGNSQTTNNEVLVYDHQREGQQQEFGAWSRYTNHSATGWANLGNNAFFGTTAGEVFKIRVAGDSTDFRDDDQAVDDMVIVLRANDFGQPGSRKIISNIIAHFQLRRSSMTATEVFSSADLDGVFQSAGVFNMIKDGTIKVDTESVTLPRRRLVYIQLKFTNSTKDEDVVLSGVDYGVALLSEAGIKEISE